ncbi:hypothetical protein F751_2505 [Auxenochlorella protothecoides]|uniref:Uncharacterized protein n=1 Tax=Auxenochlorella protothecoides TaxID=3075 RepID=A0A087SIV9_AUXPR|nr:hypothetical protein F751_2505 [Auxenochlorella protothecoides]KFM25663.1 hypothetical protein F751_2505 [Auxenochlorella protothecoides]
MSAAISLKRAGRPAIMVMVRTRGAREAPPPPLAGLGGRSLSDEELAWRLHQELNAGMGSPALHTRTRNPGTSTEGTSGEGGSWYRARVVKDAGDRVLLEFTGFEDQFPALWLARGTDRIWRGSYRGKDWKPAAVATAEIGAAGDADEAPASPAAKRVRRILDPIEVYGSILGALGACVAGQEGVADLARCGSWDNPAKPLLFSACGGWSETRILEVSSDLFAPRALALEEVGARPPLPLFH